MHWYRQMTKSCLIWANRYKTLNIPYQPPLWKVVPFFAYLETTFNNNLILNMTVLTAQYHSFSHVTDGVSGGFLDHCCFACLGTSSKTAHVHTPTTIRVMFLLLLLFCCCCCSAAAAVAAVLLLLFCCCCCSGFHEVPWVGPTKGYLFFCGGGGGWSRSHLVPYLVLTSPLRCVGAIRKPPKAKAWHYQEKIAETFLVTAAHQVPETQGAHAIWIIPWPLFSWIVCFEAFRCSSSVSKNQFCILNGTFRSLAFHWFLHVLATKNVSQKIISLQRSMVFWIWAWLRHDFFETGVSMVIWHPKLIGAWQRHEIVGYLYLHFSILLHHCHDFGTSLLPLIPYVAQNPLKDNSSVPKSSCFVLVSSLSWLFVL